MTMMTHDTLSNLLANGLRDALRNVDFDALPKSRDGLKLVYLGNSHRKDELLLPEAPADAMIPWRYEGDYRVPHGLSASQPFDKPTPESHRSLPISDDPLLVRFAACEAIYA